MQAKKSIKSNSYEILSTIPLKHGDLVLLDLDETLIFNNGRFASQNLLVHPKLPSLLDKLQREGVVCIGLTARDDSLISVTQAQLSGLKISFSLAQQLLSASDFQGQDFTYQNGVFYTPSIKQNGHKLSTKGETAKVIVQTLKSLDEQTLEAQNLNPKHVAKRIIALDDLPMNLEAIELGLEPVKEALGIESIASHLVHKKALFVSNKQDNTVFPEDLSSLEFVRHIDGGSGGVYVLKSDGLADCKTKRVTRLYCRTTL